MIHSTLLIDLRKAISDQLTYNPPLESYTGEEDDILVFAHSARMAGKYCSRYLVFTVFSLMMRIAKLRLTCLLHMHRLLGSLSQGVFE